MFLSCVLSVVTAEGPEDVFGRKRGLSGCAGSGIVRTISRWASERSFLTFFRCVLRTIWPNDVRKEDTGFFSNCTVVGFEQYALIARSKAPDVRAVSTSVDNPSTLIYLKPTALVKDSIK